MALRSPVEELMRRCVYGPVSETVAVVGFGIIQIAAAICLLLPPLRWAARILLMIMAALAISVFFVTPRLCFNVWHPPWFLSEAGHCLVTLVGLAAGGMAVLQARK